MYFFEQHAVKKLLGLLGTADAPEAVGGEKDNRLEVLEYDDVCMMDTTTTDYNGRICLVKAPGDKGSFFRRPFIDGDTAIMCHITDGNELKRCTLEELEIHGVVTAIVRKLEAEEQPDQTMWAEFEDKYPSDPLINYYPMNWDYALAARRHVRGDAGACFWYGYQYGFAQGRRAERNGKRRERRRRVKEHG